MGPEEFINLQEALIWVFGPVAQWLLVVVLFFAVVSGILSMWMPLLARMTRRR